MIVGGVDGGGTAHVLRRDVRMSVALLSSLIPNMSTFDFRFSCSWSSWAHIRSADEASSDSIVDFRISFRTVVRMLVSGLVMVEARFNASTYGAVGLATMGGGATRGGTIGHWGGSYAVRERHSITADLTLLSPEMMSANSEFDSVLPLAFERRSSIFLNCSTVSVDCGATSVGGGWRD